MTVTALRRSATLQSAPLSISALSRGALTQMGANEINDYYRLIPNLNVTAGLAAPFAVPVGRDPFRPGLDNQSREPRVQGEVAARLRLGA